MGPKWSQSQNERGERRLDDADDYVRIEIATALARGKRVIPTLVGGAKLPKSDELPEDIRRLVRRQAAELTDSRWQYDTTRLLNIITGRTDQAAMRGGPSVAQVFNRLLERASPDRSSDAVEVGSHATPVTGSTDAQMDVPDVAQQETRSKYQTAMRVIADASLPLTTAIVLVTYAHRLKLGMSSEIGSILSYAAAFVIACAPLADYRPHADLPIRSLLRVVLSAISGCLAGAAFFGMYAPYEPMASSLPVGVSGLVLGVGACVLSGASWGRYPLQLLLTGIAVGGVWMLVSAVVYDFLNTWTQFFSQKLIAGVFVLPSEQEHALGSGWVTYLYQSGFKLKIMLALAGLAMGGAVQLAFAVSRMRTGDRNSPRPKSVRL